MLPCTPWCVSDVPRGTYAMSAIDVVSVTCDVDVDVRARFDADVAVAVAVAADVDGCARLSVDMDVAVDVDVDVDVDVRARLTWDVVASSEVRVVTSDAASRARMDAGTWYTE